LKKNQKKSLLITIFHNNSSMRITLTTTVLLLSCSIAFAQSFTQPVGISKVTIDGSGTDEAAYTALSVTYENAPLYSGTVNTASGTVISLTTSDLSTSAYAGTDPNGNATHYVLLTSGDNEGLSLEIVANTINTITVTSDNLESLSLGGVTVEILAHSTIADIFGAENSAGLTSGSSVNNSDRIYIMQPDGSGGWDSYFYQTNPRGGNGWRQVGDASTDFQSLTLPLDTGILIRRIGSDDLTLYVYGSVKKTGSHMRVLGPGFSLLGNPFPVDIELGESGLYSADNGYVSTSSHTTSDRLFVIAADGSFDSFYYQTNPRGGSGWRRTGDSSTDVSSEILPATSSFYIQHRGTGLTWNPSRPYTL
jgi:uncharacterized protein (TIGR02597 family)